MLIGSGFVGVIITLLAIALVYFLLKLLIDRAPFLSPEAKTWVHYALLVVIVLWLISLILVFCGVPLGSYIHHQ
jgi:heme A synthase